MRPDSLIPLTSPSAGDLTENTALVGPAHSPSPAELLRNFTRSFERLDRAPQAPALVVTTSGSTGAPKQTVLSAAALTASGRATGTFTGTEHAQWLLALPIHYVAGAQVLARSALAGTTPVITRSVSQNQHFTAADFVDSAAQLTATHCLTSLVPTQLHKLLEAAAAENNGEILGALRSFTAILLGGAPASASLLQQADDLGIRVLTTYGSAETAGGCVYRDQPLPSVLTHLEPETEEDAARGRGRIWLGGPTLAAGYLDDAARTAAHFFTDEQGNRWYKTDDRGSLTDRLTVLGRADDTVITGGIKVSAGTLAHTLESHPAVREAMVFGLDDKHWGQALTSALTLVGGQKLHPGVLAPTSALGGELTALVTEQLGRAAVPKLSLIMEDFPTLSTGKPNRAAVQAVLEAHYAQQ